MNTILVVGLSHKTAPVEMRERFHVEDRSEALRSLRQIAEEAALLSTCNRFELYLRGVRGPEDAVGWLAERSGLTPDEVLRHSYTRVGRNACKHLFFVASSLDSLVVGETQIRGQVKEAYEAAQAAGTVGPILHQLFRSALGVSKEIAERTGVTRGNVSVAGAAADLAERVFGDLAAARTLVIGAGETAELVLTHLQGRGVKRCRVANRTLESARELAARFDGEACGLEDLPRHLEETDVVVCAAGGEEPLVGAAMVRSALRKRRGRPILLFDIAVPRGIDPAVGKLDNVYRYDMDALAEVTRHALSHRRRDFLECCTLIDAATLRFQAARRAQDAGPLIAELERRYSEVARAEIESSFRRPGLEQVPREEIERMVYRIVKKLLHLPVRALRDGAPEESDVIRRVFIPPRDEEKP